MSMEGTYAGADLSAGALPKVEAPAHEYEEQAGMNHFYRDVPKLGNVAVSRHAQQRAEEDGISQEAFDRVLLTPITPDTPDGADILWRERDGIRLVILTNPTPNTGAKLVKTVYRIEAQAKALK